MAIVAVYDSTNLYKRMELWKDLNDLHSNHPLPWAFFQDFNVIIGAYEHWGRNSPAKRPMIDFQSWTNSNNLTHLATSGARYTWSNKRDPHFSIERRLDRCIGNSLWVDDFNCIVTSTLPKVFSNHYPLLLDFHINFARLVSQFKFLSTWSLHEGCKMVIESIWF